MKTSVWTTIIDCNGTKKPISTVQGATQGDAEFMRVHLQAVAAAEAACAQQAPEPTN